MMVVLMSRVDGLVRISMMPKEEYDQRIEIEALHGPGRSILMPGLSRTVSVDMTPDAFDHWLGGINLWWAELKPLMQSSQAGSEG